MPYRDRLLVLGSITGPALVLAALGPRPTSALDALGHFAFAMVLTAPLWIPLSRRVATQRRIAQVNTHRAAHRKTPFRRGPTS